MNEVYLLTGGNMGDRMQNLNKALTFIEAGCGEILATSSVYETAAWGFEDQPSFLNQVLCIRSSKSPSELLSEILRIEEKLGRKRDLRYGPRLIDIDILFYNDEVIMEKGLQIPHPQMPFRRFVLKPLTEIAPDKIHPVLKKTLKQLLADCPDPLAVHKFC